MAESGQMGKQASEVASRPVAAEAVEERTEKCGIRGWVVGTCLFMSISKVAKDDRRDPEPTGFRGRLKEEQGRCGRERGWDATSVMVERAREDRAIGAGACSA